MIQKTIFNIENNPFYILKASPRDTKSKIIELADEMSLSIDSEICNKSRSDLTNPRNRITYEVSWFPGLSPKKSFELSQLAITKPRVVLNETVLPPLVLANLWIIFFEDLNDQDEEIVFVEALLNFSKVLEKISVQDILRDVNEDRMVSGFPEITSLELIENAFLERKKVFKAIVRDALNRLFTDKLINVMTEFVKEATIGGEAYAPEFLYSLIDSYEVETQKFQSNELDASKNLCNAILTNAENKSSLEPNLSNLIKVSENFVRIVKPIQLAYKSRGLEHELSRDFAFTVRSLAIDLHNKYNNFDSSLKLTQINKNLFESIPEFVDRVNEDENTLYELQEEKVKSEEDKVQWAKDIVFSAEIGLVFKETLSLSASGASYGNKKYSLDSLCRIGWGAVKNTVNGIPTGTEYTVFFGDTNSQAVITTRKEKIYLEFTDRLWRAVGFRIITDIMAHLRSGKSMNFKEMKIWDDRATLKKHKTFGSEDITCQWSDLQIWSAGGSMYLGHTKDNKIYSELPYIDTANAHLIEALIRHAFKKAGMTKLSESFD